MNKLTNPFQFILGGRAAFGLYSLKTGKHITYYVALRGSDYLITHNRIVVGVMDGESLQVKQSTDPRIDQAAKAFSWYWTRVLDGKTVQQIEEEQCFAYHLGRCCVCRQRLKDPESIRLGIGPICRSRRG
jgi:Family of unknown function (DUF6011)